MRLSYPGAPTESLRTVQLSCVKMDGFRVLQVLLLALWPAQLSWGDIMKLRKFSTDPVNYNIIEIDFEDGLTSPRHGASTVRSQMSKREIGGVPSVDGEYHFNDGYRHGRVHYTGDNSDVIVVLTYNLDGNDDSFQSNLYRSTDYGLTFTNINNKVENATMLYQDFFVKGDQLIFAHTSRAKIFYSLDGGASFTTVNLNPKSLDTHTIEYHSTRDGWMMILDDENTLYVTKTYGGNWTAVAGNVVSYQWGDDKWDESSQSIYFTSRDPKKGLLLYKSNHPYTSVTIFDPALGDHDAFQLVGRYMFAQHTDDDGVVSLYVSDQRKPFKEALIPSSLPHQSYLVTHHIDELQAMVIVEHEGGFYNLYLSDETGVYFTLSLSDIFVVTQPQQQIDLEVIEGVNGTLIANQFIREDRSALIQTVISLDNGGFWEPLRPPEVYLNGTEVKCEPPDCSLHLHIDTTSYSRLGVYSTDSAPGIIVAHGNLGDRLSRNPDLYISHNGGVSWREILEGSWGVNVADHGGLMVAAKDYHQEQSTVLKYSCNEGKTWSDFQFISSNFTVFGVITEPGQHTTVVSLYGGPWDRGVPFTWTVVTVDFRNIFPRMCGEDDYYIWKPWNDRSESECILGSSVTIERRDPDVCCLNGRNYDREVDFKICDCTFDDFECDYGFARPSHDFNAPCIRDRAIYLFDPCSDGENKTYLASTGYRKIPGDVCVDGEEHLFKPFEAPCCGNTTLPPAVYNPSPPTQEEGSSSDGTSVPPAPQRSSVPPAPQRSSVPPAPQRSSVPPAPQEKEESSSDGVSVSVVIGMGIIVAIFCAAAIVFLVLFLVFSVKYKTTRRKYIRIATAGEPDLLTYTVNSSGREADELTPVFDGEDDDDKPLVP